MKHFVPRLVDPCVQSVNRIYIPWNAKWPDVTSWFCAPWPHGLNDDTSSHVPCRPINEHLTNWQMCHIMFRYICRNMILQLKSWHDCENLEMFTNQQVQFYFELGHLLEKITKDEDSSPWVAWETVDGKLLLCS